MELGLGVFLGNPQRKQLLGGAVELPLAALISNGAGQRADFTECLHGMSEMR